MVAWELTRVRWNAVGIIPFDIAWFFLEKPFASSSLSFDYIRSRRNHIAPQLFRFPPWTVRYPQGTACNHRKDKNRRRRITCVQWLEICCHGRWSHLPDPLHALYHHCYYSGAFLGSAHHSPLEVEEEEMQKKKRNKKILLSLLNSLRLSLSHFL